MIFLFVFLFLVGGLQNVLAIQVENERPLDWNDPKWAWMDERIKLDFLSLENSGISESMVDRVIQKALHRLPHVVRLQVIDGKVYGPETEGKRLLEKIATIYPVPSVDVVIYGEDIIPNFQEYPGPILVTCRVNGEGNQIIFPSQLWETWVYFSTEVEKSCEKSPWKSKISKFFWRGKPNDASNYLDQKMWTKHRRGKFCYLSRQFPELIDATFSSYWDSTLGDLVEEFFNVFPKKIASWDEYIQHKYLVDLDGFVACTPGYAWKLLTNCTVFKHESPFILWFYGALEPWVHYVPFKADLSDIFEKLEWAKAHDEEAQQIAENGRHFARENLLPEHLYLYCYKVLLKYASLQKFSPRPKSF